MPPSTPLPPDMSLDLQHTTMAVVAWQMEHGTIQFLTKPDPKSSAITLKTWFNAEAAFFEFAVRRADLMTLHDTGFLRQRCPSNRQLGDTIDCVKDASSLQPSPTDPRMNDSSLDPQHLFPQCQVVVGRLRGDYFEDPGSRPWCRNGTPLS
ncbi:hypothetical protein FGADI_12790 [Fusarium gaditjirri]|uniref:Uncharacterized protein n=1 Tax=Fusarium gaditjirri TaxID=282569 RepID=A0A8H4SRP7_9HYPO|nr:hypothetical protein FGADI_12790 [Fusarium gaditjirri]